MSNSRNISIVLRTRFGRLTLVYEGESLRAIRFGGYGRDASAQGIEILSGGPPNPDARSLIKDMKHYFSGQPGGFSAEPDIEEYSDFQRAVWRTTSAIPHGQTLSYGQIASELGRRKGARAVGNALGMNPFPIVIPCHRVIGRDGALTGFGGGIAWKRALLGLEKGQIELFKGGTPGQDKAVRNTLSIAVDNSLLRNCDGLFLLDHFLGG